MKTARQLQFKADDIIAIYLRYNVIAGVKAALSLEGLDVGEPNAPLPHFDTATREAFLNELKAKGFPQNY